MDENLIMEMVRVEYENKRDMFPQLKLPPWDEVPEAERQHYRKLLDIDTIDVQLDEPLSTFRPPQD